MRGLRFITFIITLLFAINVVIGHDAAAKRKEHNDAASTLQAPKSQAEQKEQISRALQKGKDYLPFVNMKSPEGSQFYHQYFSLVRDCLAHFQFNVNDTADERTWKLWLANQMVYFCFFCDSLPNREDDAFDNSITRKDFLRYHIRKYNQLPMTWRDIQSQLASDEAVLEICSLPEEVLVLRTGYSHPKSIPMDSLLVSQIVEQLADEPLAINALYSQQGPLFRMWQGIEPYLNGVKTIYVSGANAFSQINYGAIPLAGGGIVDDKYVLHTLLSSSNAGIVKDYAPSMRLPMPLCLAA